VTIHATDPFATPEGAKSAVRRLRGRLAAPVTLWTAYGNDGRPAGLTVSSTLVVDGEPAHVAGIVDEESDVYTALTHSGAFAVCVLTAADRRIADIFAGIMPAPGGPFGSDWVSTAYGPVPAGERTWAGCRLGEIRPLGWGLLVLGSIDAVRLGDEDRALIHYRGRYADGPAGGPA
jgi:flavin reductase (DIM6/NTAB) family NADH-FMN oxidoreductase RutF